jgi:hypothetical protein
VPDTDNTSWKKARPWRPVHAVFGVMFLAALVCYGAGLVLEASLLGAAGLILETVAWVSLAFDD